MTTTLAMSGTSADDSGLLRRIAIPFLVACALILAGCSSDPDQRKTEERTGKGVGIGAAAGAAGGALFGAMAGSPGTGAAIGAATGAVLGGAGGYIYDQNKKRKKSESENEELKRENEELRKQQQQQQQQQSQKRPFGPRGWLRRESPAAAVSLRPMRLWDGDEVASWLR